ncbi:NAD(P)/FAD-dependent oxidoreductase [Alteribacillus sp. HJP-4]|uniref:NAD(P)/FAD-dependent oxidoreductase n=1 Tax=Alteribacillus sp. HJP-4 TaxID=2775394 RepID=UPI0035CD1A33
MKIAIVGAGIVGVSAAYHLSRNGFEVLLIDKEHQGEATAAGAGIICPWLSSKAVNPDWYRFAKESACYYPKLIELLNQDEESQTGFCYSGAMAVSDNGSELDRLEAMVMKRREAFPEAGKIRRLNSQQARELFPPLREGLQAVHVTGGARVDGNLIRLAMKRAAKKHGAVIHHGEADLHIENGRCTRILMEDRDIEADAVIAAGGAWVKKQLNSIGVHVKVEPQRGQIIHLEINGKDTAAWPVILPQSSHYLVSFADSRVVIGATRETGSGFDYRLTAGGVHEVLQEGLKIAPGLADATLLESRIGFRPASEDQLPLLGNVPEVKNLVIATGLGPSGLTMGPLAGVIAAELAVKNNISMDLRAYDPLR